MIFDTHAHYDDSQFDEDRETVLNGLAAAGVGCVVDVGSTVQSLEKIRELTERYPFVYGAVGLHPDEVGQLTPEIMEELEKLLQNPRILAVGEIGLDYHWDVEPHDVQIRCFQEQMRLARRCGKPIIVHSRTAAADTLQVIREMYEDSGIELPGIIHSYSGSLEQAKIYTAMGFFLGIGGVVTYPNSKKLKKVVQGIPLSYLVLETDCPYLSPEEKRGSRNISANLSYVVKAIAELKGVTEEEVERVTEANARRLFGLNAD
ncbi:MAG: TatD family hydrolase [Lachnospiraceae bacterium]|nr:TatD family hydrolase [Lachnospiraceae bacterium]